MVLLLVLQPGKPGLEVLVTEGAFERPVLRVQDHVLLQVRPASEGLQANSTFPAITLPLLFSKKLLNVVWMKPTDVLGQSLLASVQLAAEGTLVLLLLKRGVAGMLVPVDTQIGLGGVALQTDVALEWLLSCVHSGVTLILTCTVKDLFTFGTLEYLLAGADNDDWSQAFGVHWTLGGASCSWIGILPISLFASAHKT